MSASHVYTYESATGMIRFALDTPFWISDIAGKSSVDISLSTVVGSGQVGASVISQSVKPRSFTVDGAIFEPLGANRTRLLGAMAPQQPGVLKTTVDGTEWYLDVIPERTPDVSEGIGAQLFQLRLFAGYPYWRTTGTFRRQLTGLTPLFMFPFNTAGTFYISSHGDNYFAQIHNSGNVPIDFRVIFRAHKTVENPELYHMGTGQKIKVNKVMMPGENVTVSTIFGQKGVTVMGAGRELENGFRYLSTDSDLRMALLPGENLLRIDALTGRDGLGVEIEAPEGVRSGI